MKDNKKPKDGDLVTTTDSEGHTWSWVHNSLFDTPNKVVKDDKIRLGMMDMNTGMIKWMDDEK